VIFFHCCLRCALNFSLKDGVWLHDSSEQVSSPTTTIFAAEHHEIFDSHEFETRSSKEYPNLTPAEIFPQPRSRWGLGIVSRFLLAALVVFFLTWGTTVLLSFFMTLVSKAPLAAVLVASFTPTVIPAVRGSVNFATSQSLGTAREDWPAAQATSPVSHRRPPLPTSSAVSHVGLARNPFNGIYFLSNLRLSNFSGILAPVLTPLCFSARLLRTGSCFS
jgi:hypothetical protein